MQVNKAMLELGMVRSMGEVTRLVKQGAVLVGGCIQPCNMRITPFKCTCGGWRKVTDFREEVLSGTVVRIGKGNYRLLPREDGKQGFNQLKGIGWIPEDMVGAEGVEPSMLVEP